jgi:hypothetical protein
LAKQIVAQQLSEVTQGLNGSKHIADVVSLKDATSSSPGLSQLVRVRRENF